jgi:hypothetical protein
MEASRWAGFTEPAPPLICIAGRGEATAAAATNETSRAPDRHPADTRTVYSRAITWTEPRSELAVSRLVFMLFIGLDAAALGLFFVLGLAFAKPSHTPVLQVVGFFLLPALLLAGLVLLYLRGPWPASRGVAIGVAALPVLLVLGSAVVTQGVAWQLGEPGDGWGQPDRAAQQRLEVAIRARDGAAVARIAADRNSRVNDGAALVAALRQLEQQPVDLGPLRALLQAGVQPNVGGGAEAPLAAAIRASRHAGAEPVQLLLNAGADPNFRGGSQPAWFAALSNHTHPAVLSALLERGADLRAVDMAGSGAVHWAAFHQNWAAAALLIERGADWQAARAANGEGLRQMVSAQLRRNPGDPALVRLERLLRAPS